VRPSLGFSSLVNPSCCLSLCFYYQILRPTLDGSVGSKFLGTNLVSFEANWILEFVLALDPSLHLGSPNHDLSFELLFLGGSKPIDFPFKMVPCGFSLNLSPAILEKCYSPLGQLPFNANYYPESLPVDLLKEFEEKKTLLVINYRVLPTSLQNLFFSHMIIYQGETQCRVSWGSSTIESCPMACCWFTLAHKFKSHI